MKKLFYFSLCLVLCVITFAFVSSAAAPSFGALAPKIDEIPDNHLFGCEEHHDEQNDGWYNEEAARVLLTYTKDGQTLTATYPTYYIVKNDSTLTWDFSYVSKALGVDLTVENITQIEIPYGITDIPVRAFVDDSRWDPTVSEKNPYGHATESTALNYVRFPDTLLRIEDFAFAHCTSLDTIEAHVGSGTTGVHDHIRINHVGYRAFHHCAISWFPFNAHLTHLGEGAFEGCRFTEINLSKCVELNEIPAYCFHESDAVTVEVIIVGPHVKKIGDYAFTGASAEKVFIGTRVEEIGHGALSMADVDIVFLPVTIKTIYKDSVDFGNKGYKTYVVASRDIDEIQAMLDVLNTTDVDWKNVSASGLLRDTLKYFDNSDAFCVEYLGGHLIDTNSSVTSVSFPNGIQFEGVASGTCGVCLNAIETAHLAPILVSKGYSICTFNDKYAFANGFEVYHDSLYAYEQVYGRLELGILFALNDKYQSVDLYSNIGSMGIAMTFVTAEEDNFQYESFDFIMYYSKGIEITNANGISRGEEQVVIAAYAKETNGTIHYVQDDDHLCMAGNTTDGKYATVSYRSIYGYIETQGLL